MKQRIAAFGIAGVIVALDQATKASVRAHIAPFDSIGLIPNWLRLVHAENSGAAFSFLADANPLLRGLVLIGISAAVLAFVVSTLWKRQQPTLTAVALALVMGGAFGNLWDRIIRHTVTDFIEVYHGDWSFPAFNAADSAITVGAALLVIELLFARRSHVSKTH